MELGLLAVLAHLQTSDYHVIANTIDEIPNVTVVTLNVNLSSVPLLVNVYRRLRQMCNIYISLSQLWMEKHPLLPERMTMMKFQVGTLTCG